ncbi:sugar ABC transporter ATP-binding protein [Aeromicrobium sp. NPDC092404]|uniref:sugar ABC transporter ATP-binding protein n=1 Tax=Aeromicrobium sp. NPDC092404 TaxID=3154976 RepID=UPI003420249C
MPATASALSTRGLTMSYPGMRALSDFDLDLHPGEIHGVVGANGAGKSTLIKILSGLLTPTGGSIAVAGEDVVIRNAGLAQRLGISVVHQELPLLPNLTAAQNIAVGREEGRLLSPASRRSDRLDYRRAARDFPGAPSATSRLEDESLFAWQVVAIMRAMASKARVLILDEPTSSLTLDERHALHVRLRAVAAQGIAVLYVSHFLDDILEVASVVSVLRDGRLVHRGPCAALDEDALLSHMTSGTARAAAVQACGDVDDSPAALGRTGAGGLVLNRVETGRTTIDGTLNVAPGEIVGLYGLEDSGARDLVEAIFGLRRRSGSISWDGAELPGTPRDSIRRGVALATGDRKRAAIGEWTVEANHVLPQLSVMPLLARRPSRSGRAETVRSIDAFAVKGTPGQKMAMLSGGNQQKILLARWITTATGSCLLLDEPTHGVDVSGRLAIHEQLRAFAARGGSVLLHSTDPEEIVALCHRAVPFASGRPLRELSRDELTIDRLEHMVRASTRHHTPSEVTP